PHRLLHSFPTRRSSDLLRVDRHGSPSFVRLEGEIESRVVLKLQAGLHAVRAAADHDKWCHESDGLEVFAKLIRVPDLAMLRFQRSEEHTSELQSRENLV